MKLYNKRDRNFALGMVFFWSALGAYDLFWSVKTGLQGNPLAIAFVALLVIAILFVVKNVKQIREYDARTKNSHG